MESEGMERYGMESEANVRQVKTWKARNSMGRKAMAWKMKEMQGMAWKGKEWNDMAWKVKKRQGME
jgi:hypothetical protein